MRKMEPKEPLEVRREMVDMHEGFKKSLSDKIGAEDYIAASWICCAIFEQRINRLMQKHIDQCPHKPFDDRKSPKIAAISVKIKCLECLVCKKYGGYANFDANLLGEIHDWCQERNKLTHQLINLNNYHDYNMRFQKLASDGIKLVDRLYEEVTKFRAWWGANQFDGEFPVSKNICDRKHHCVPERGDIADV